MLRSKYGWEGEGRFWALNNLIGSAENCILDLNKKAVQVSIADELDYSVEVLMEFIQFLAEECELVISLDNKLTTEMVRENLKEVMKQRKRMQNTRNKNLRGKLSNDSDSLDNISEN